MRVTLLAQGINSTTSPSNKGVHHHNTNSQMELIMTTISPPLERSNNFPRPTMNNNSRSRCNTLGTKECS